MATVRGQFPKEALRRLKEGVVLEDGRVDCDSVRIVQQAADRSMVEVVIHEGRNRIVRRMFDEIGFPVQDLVRTRIGSLFLGQQRPGVMRDVVGPELRALYTEAGL